MIDDTGPRITALERRVAALEREAVRFADLSSVFNAHYGDHPEVRFGQKVRALEAIEQARAAREDSGGGGGGAGTVAAASVHDATPPTPSPSLADAMEALRARFIREGGGWSEIMALSDAWDRSKAAIVEADDIERKWKARAEAGDKLLREAMSNTVGWLQRAITHLQKGTP